MKKKRNFNSKGFTLIELLAVITIMGILMLTAIPAVSRTIQNSRKDTFANVAKNYINAVRSAVLADNVICYNGYNTPSTYDKASAYGDGTYYFPICTDTVFCNNIQSTRLSTAIQVESNQNLMESMSKSPFGGASLKGYVQWVKAGNKTTYSIVLIDAGGNGIATNDADDKPTVTVAETSLTRNSVKTTGIDKSKATSKIPDDDTDNTNGPYPCKME